MLARGPWDRAENREPQAGEVGTRLDGLVKTVGQKPCTDTHQQPREAAQESGSARAESSCDLPGGAAILNDAHVAGRRQARR